MPPKRCLQLTSRRQRGEQSLDHQPISPIPGQRWRADVLAATATSALLPAEHCRIAAGGRVATASGLGFTGTQAEVLLVRCGLALVVWTTLVVDLRKRQHRAWSYLYTHWNLLLYAGYSVAALLSSLLAGHIENRPSRKSTSLWFVGRWASRLSSLLFPVMATTHPFLDLGYFLFLHGRLAARSGWPGGWAYLLGGMHPTAVSKHLLNAVRLVHLITPTTSTDLTLNFLIVGDAIASRSTSCFVFTNSFGSRPSLGLVASPCQSSAVPDQCYSMHFTSASPCGSTHDTENGSIRHLRALSGEHFSLWQR